MLSYLMHIKKVEFDIYDILGVTIYIKSYKISNPFDYTVLSVNSPYTGLVRNY